MYKIYLFKIDISCEVGCQTLKSLFLFTSFSELIYKEVMDLEERTKNGVIRGQPSPLGWLQYKLG